jgi:arylsulfatase A-like enzyme
LLTFITTVTHEPYNVPEWFDEPKEGEYERYLQALNYSDYFIEDFLKQLSARGLDKNTLICLIGDHGTCFRSDTNKTRWNPYEEVVRVPWIINWPGHIDPGQKIQWPCSQLDVTPTILSLIGFDITKAGFDGKDALIPSDNNRRLFFSSWYPNSPMGFKEGDRKVVYWPYTDKLFEYDLAQDPQEERPSEITSREKKDVIKKEIYTWKSESQIYFAPKRYTEQLLYSHWQTFSLGNYAWAFYKE